MPCAALGFCKSSLLASSFCWSSWNQFEAIDKGLAMCDNMDNIESLPALPCWREGRSELLIIYRTLKVITISKITSDKLLVSGQPLS